VSSNASANQIIVFDASGSYDIDNIIISYQWDFGDGTTGSGVSPEHVYENPGEYTVTLVITDINDNTCSKTMTVNIVSGVGEKQSEDQNLLPFYLGIGVIGGTLTILVCVAVLFRDNIASFVLTYQIEKLETKIRKMKKIETGYWVIKK